MGLVEAVRRGGLPPPSELALAAVVTAAVSVDLGAARSTGLALAVLLPAGLSVAWRSRLPELPLLLVCLADLVLAASAPGDYGPQTVVLGVLVVVFTAAQRLTGRRAVVAGAASLVLIAAAHYATREGDPGDFLPYLVWGAPWAAGRLVRRQALVAREAGARAALMEVEAREATARERDRIARELHDVVAHAVSLMVVQAGAERVALDDASPRTAAALDAIETSGRQALAELRAMLGVLRGRPDDAAGLAPQPGLTDLPALVGSVRAAGLEVQLELVGDLGAVAPGPSLAAYRVAQESLTNALRHAGSPVRLQVVVEPGAVRVEAVNALRADGSTRPSETTGRGLLGMRERVEAFGGRLQAGPDGSTWRVCAALPLLGAGAVR